MNIYQKIYRTLHPYKLNVRKNTCWQEQDEFIFNSIVNLKNEEDEMKWEEAHGAEQNRKTGEWEV